MNAHGTSTKKNDQFETIAYKEAFGEHAKKIHISSIKVCSKLYIKDMKLYKYLLQAEL